MPRRRAGAWSRGQAQCIPTAAPLLAFRPSRTGQNQGGKQGERNVRYSPLSQQKRPSKSPLISFGYLLEYITWLHTDIFTHVCRLIKSTRKKYFKKVKITFLINTSCSSRNCRKITACVPTPIKVLNGLHPACM